MAYITIQVLQFRRHDGTTHRSTLSLAIPVRYRALIGRHCAWAGTAPEGRWLTGTEAQLWLQLPGVVVQG